MFTLSPSLRKEYQYLFDTCEIRPKYRPVVEPMVQLILDHQTRYQLVAEGVGMPWYGVALIHALESSPPFSLTGHLHNGDPLTARTVRVPAGRPKSGRPPFSWEESAVDALRHGGLDQWHDWSIPGLLFQLERFNGWGYRRFHPDVPSPYLWSFTNHYAQGKYVQDGRFSPTAISKQCGAAALLLRLRDAVPLANAANANPNALIVYTKKAAPHVEALQEFLNRCPGIALAVDGVPGPRTSQALKRVTGNFLLGDPRGVRAT